MPHEGDGEIAKGECIIESWRTFGKEFSKEIAWEREGKIKWAR